MSRLIAQDDGIHVRRRRRLAFVETLVKAMEESVSNTSGEEIEIRED